VPSHHPWQHHRPISINSMSIALLLLLLLQIMSLLPLSSSCLALPVPTVQVLLVGSSSGEGSDLVARWYQAISGTLTHEQVMTTTDDK
jgi:hypothetical protein